MMQNHWQKILLSLFKVTVFIIASYFIFQVFKNNLTALKAIEIKNGAMLVMTCIFSLVIYTVLMMTLVFAWLVLLKFTQPQRCASIYLKSQILKYLPGNVLHFAYRHQQTKNDDFTHKQLGLAAMNETVYLVISALLISHLLFLWPAQNTWLVNWLPIPTWSFITIELMGLIFIFHWLKTASAPTVIICYLIYFFGMGLITYLLMHALGFESQHYLFLTACFAASWLAGYVIPGAPGGTGVRELVFILLCAPKMAEHEALIIIALIRVLSVLAETSIYFTASKLSGFFHRFGHLNSAGKTRW